MKVKDLKAKLKQESENISVPDVFTNAKRAPLNKLLIGETPRQAFKKNLANMLLIIVVVLFVVAVISTAALFLNPDNGTEVTKSYVAVIITKDDANQSRYGMVIDSKGNVLTCTKEWAMVNGTNSYPLESFDIVDNNIESTIKSIVETNGNCTVGIGVLSTDSKIATNLRSNALSALSECSVTVRSISEYATRVVMAGLIESNSEYEINEDISLKDLIGYYLTIVA